MAVDTVADRFAFARSQLSPTAMLLALVAALGFTLAFMQEPLAHDAMQKWLLGTSAAGSQD